MTQEQKDLLLKDLCSRLPYGVKYMDILNPDEHPSTLQSIDNCGLVMANDGFSHEIENVKPYLFPLENMTEEQKNYINNRWGVNENFDFEIDPNWGKYFVELGDVVDFINWCYENHLDINGLIPKDLANDATGLNIY